MKNKVLIMLLAFTVILVGCKQTPKIYDKETEEKVVAENETNRPKEFKYISESSVVFDETLKPVPVEQWDEVREEYTINWVFDPYCPACTELETATKDTVKNILKTGFAVKYHPLAFLSPKTVEDYSVRASSFILGAAEYAPEVALKFMENVLDVEQRPTPGEHRTTEQLKELFLKSEGTEEQWDAIMKDFEIIADAVRKATSNAFNTPKFIDRNPDKKLFVPFIFIGNSNVLTFSSDVDVSQYLEDSVQKHLNEIYEKEVK